MPDRDIEMRARVEVIQADREAAGELHLSVSGNRSPFDHRCADAIRAGKNDHWPIVQAFARHRLAALSASPLPGREEIAREERLRMFLEILSAMGGCSDASESPYSWINAFCEEHEGADPDTFNLAEQRGFTWATHNTDTDHSVVTLTDKGRAFLLSLSTPPTEGDAK